MPIKSFFRRRGGLRGGLGPHGRSHITSRLVISKPVSLRKRLLWGGLAALVAALAGAGLFLAGQYSAGFSSLDSALRLRALMEENEGLRKRVVELSDNLASITTQLRIDQGARATLEAQMLKLEEDRNRLSRDLALFENLFPSSGVEGQPTIRGFRIEPASTTGNPGDLRYRLLIMRSARTGSFSGDVQVQVRYRQDGREVLAQTPDTGRVQERIEFDRYQRMEGRFQAPQGAKLLGAVARVMENGRPVAESTFQP